MKETEKYTRINAQTIDGWVEEGWEWGQPIGHETFERARAGCWSCLLYTSMQRTRSQTMDIKG